MSFRARLARGTAWISAAGLITNALGFVSTLILARLLSPSDFGLVALAATILALITSVTELSLNSALVHHAAPTSDHFSTAFTISAMRGALLAAVIALSAKLAATIYNDARFLPIMLAYAGGTFLGGLSNPRAAMMTKSLIFWQEFMLQVGGRLVGLIVSATIALLYHSYWALVWGALAAQALSAAMSYLVMPFFPRLTLSRWRELFSFSIWLSLGQIINTINWNTDQLVVGTYISKSALGYYTVGNNLAIMPSREITRPITATLFPAFTQLRDDMPRLAAAYQSAQALVTSVALPAGVGMSLVASPLIDFVMGPKWRPAVFLTQVLASVFAFQTLGTLSQPLAMATGKTRLLLKRDVQSFIIRVPAIVAGVLLGGLNGIIWARLLTGSVAIVFHMVVVKQITALTLREQVRANARSIASVGFMALVLNLTSWQLKPLEHSAVGYIAEITALVGLGGASYVGAHYIYWVLVGRPHGPEEVLLRAGSLLCHRLRPSRGRCGDVRDG